MSYNGLVATRKDALSSKVRIAAPDPSGAAKPSRELAAGESAERAVAVIEVMGPRVSAATGEPLPSAGELAAIRKQNLFRAFKERRDLLADALTVADVAKLLGVGRQTPHDRAKAGTLLAVKDNGRLLFPAWQFDPEGSDGVLAGLPDVLREIRGSMNALARVRWFLAPKSLMDGRSPLGALREGDTDSVIAEARAVGAS
jgi:hypothetical protein